jgi:hypothetical protein
MSSEAAIVTAVSSNASFQLAVHPAPDAHPDATNQLLAFIGVPLHIEVSVSVIFAPCPPECIPSHPQHTIFVLIITSAETQ